MKKRISSKVIVILLLTGLIVSFINLDVTQTIKVAGQQAEPNIFEGDVPVRGVYLLTDDKNIMWDDNGDGVNEEHHIESPLIVNLAAAGFKPGDLVFISLTGKVNYAVNGNWPNTKPNLSGVFSSSNTLLWDRSQQGQVGPLHRVPDAIDAGKDFVTLDTYYGKVSTDIPEDFAVWATGVSIKIPSGAAYLMLAIIDPDVANNDGWIKVTIEKDTDEDGLWDSWETKGIDADKDGTIDLKLPGANWEVKDIYVEVDYMDGHRFNAVARDDVVAAFRNCPGTVKNGPINVHIEVDDSEPIPIAHKDVIRVWTDFDKIKDDSFGTLTQKVDANSENILLAKEYAYHYCLFVHGIEIWNGTQWDTGASGAGEYYGNDFVVSLGIGGFENGVGSRDEQAATFMHELGHNLGLDHGGGNDTNYKPNYLSIMNYLFQFDGSPLHNRPLTFSSAKLASLNEAKLDETVGVRGANWDWTVHAGLLQTAAATSYVPLAVPTSDNIDWDNDGDDTETSVQANINNYPKWDYDSADSEVLVGYDDWSNLRFSFQENKNFAKGVHDDALGRKEITWEIVQAMREDAKDMVGGPTGPVQILDVDGGVQPSPEDQNSASSIDTNILVIVAVVVIGAISVAALFVLRKRKKQLPS